jgi:hypothetical protein
MMRIGGIYTIRDTPHPNYWDIVFEWEDQMSMTLGVPLIPVGKNYDQIYKPNALRKLLNRFNAYQLADEYFFAPQECYLAFHIGPPGVYSFYSRSNVIPIIIDFWKHEDIKRLESVFRLNPAVFVTSREVFNYLRGNGVRVKLKHLSLSLPDKYLALDNSITRDIDIIQIGRSNAVFDEYMINFLREFPETHYVSAKKTGNEVRIISSKSLIMGVFNDRRDFINLLQRSKVSLVSAPGLDEDRNRTGGFSPVTPRFLESAACGCKLIGIYPLNDDFDYYGIKEVCAPVTNYDEFKKIASEYLNKSSVPDFTAFLQKHLTSKISAELLLKLEEQNE